MFLRKCLVLVATEMAGLVPTSTQNLLLLLPKTQLEMTWLPVEISDFVTTNTAGNVQLSLNIRSGLQTLQWILGLQSPPLSGSKTTREEHVASASWQWKSGTSNLVHANDNFKVCTYSGLLCCWLEVLLLLFWFGSNRNTSTFVHNNVQVMKVAPSESVSGKSQRHWHCLPIYGDTEPHDNQQR